MTTSKIRYQLGDHGPIVTLELYGRLPLLIDAMGTLVTIVDEAGRLRLPDAKAIDRLLQNGTTRIVASPINEHAFDKIDRPIVRRILGRAGAADLRGKAMSAREFDEMESREELVLAGRTSSTTIH